MRFNGIKITLCDNSKKKQGKKMKGILNLTIMLSILSTSVMAETVDYKKITEYKNERESGLLIEMKDSEGFNVLKKLAYKENVKLKKVMGNKNTYEIIGSINNNVIENGEIIITKKVF